MRKPIDRFPTEVRQERRRLFGVSPALSGAAIERPWRYLPNHGNSLKAMAGAKRSHAK